MNWTIGKKLTLGFGTLIVLIVAVAAVVFVKVNAVNTVQKRVTELRQPTALAGKDVLNGINHSLAALRGYMILGKDKFKQERAAAWSQEIEPSIATMKGFAVNWTDPQNIERLRAIESNLEDFKRFQQEIEDIAQTLDNTPAMKILFVEAAPQAKILADNITTLSAESRALINVVMGVAAIGLVLGVAIAWYNIRSITKPLNRAIAALNEGSAQVSSASSQVSSSSQSLAEGATEQAAGLEETSSSLEEMSSMTKQNAANAEESASASEELSAQAEQMNGVVDELATMVGGSAAKKDAFHHMNASHPVAGKTPGLSQSDHVLHQIAKPALERTNSPVTSDEGLESFNS